MKKAIKICLALAGTLFALGLVLHLAGTAMGGRRESLQYYEDRWEDLSGGNIWGHIQVGSDGVHIGGENGIHVDSDGVSVGGEHGIQVGHHSESGHSGRKQSLESGELTGITTVKVDVDHGDVRIREGETFSVSLDWNLSNYAMSYDVKDGTLKVRDESWGSGYSFSNVASKVYVTIPSGAELDKLELCTAMGDIEVDAEITAKKADLSTNLGNVTCRALQAAELKAESDLGNVELHLPDGKEEYTWKLETNMGELTEDGEKRSGGLGDVAYRSGTGPNSVEASSSLGNVEICFSK